MGFLLLAMGSFGFFAIPQHTRPLKHVQPCQFSNYTTTAGSMVMGPGIIGSVFIVVGCVFEVRGDVGLFGLAENLEFLFERTKPVLGVAYHLRHFYRSLFDAPAFSFLPLFQNLPLPRWIIQASDNNAHANEFLQTFPAEAPVSQSLALRRRDALCFQPFGNAANNGCFLGFVITGVKFAVFPVVISVSVHIGGVWWFVLSQAEPLPLPGKEKMRGTLLDLIVFALARHLPLPANSPRPNHVGR